MSGPVEQSVSDAVAVLTTGDPLRAPLAAAAVVLARTLDEGAGLSTAAVARELRATLAALTEKEPRESGDALDAWIAGLSAEVGDSPVS